MATNRRKPNPPKAIKRKRPTKIDTVLKMLRRDKGASIAQLQKATGWQPHSVRAALTGLRNQKIGVVRSKDEAGTTRYAVQGE